MKKAVAERQPFGLIKNRKEQNMRILFLGDVVGSVGTDTVRARLSRLKRDENIDLVLLNGENSDNGNGVSPYSANELFMGGADVITTGNHVYRKNSVYDYLDENECIIRPANYPASNPGRGYTTVFCKGKRVLVINLLGRAFMDFDAKDPFETVDTILEKEKGKYDISILDIHAESTSEKVALAHYFDSRIDLIVGTHTHIQTADERILPGGSAYITDLGMCGVLESALGVDFEPVIKKFRSGMPQRFTEAKGEASLLGIVAEYDEKKSAMVSIKRIKC